MITGGAIGRDADAPQPRRRDRLALVGRSHGAERRAARLRVRSETVPRPCARQPDQSRRRRPRRHRHSAEQHCDRPDDRLVRRRRLRRPRSGAGRDARRERRHDSDCAGSIVRRLETVAAALALGGSDVQDGRRPCARHRPRLDRTRADADRPAPAPGKHHALRRCPEPQDPHGRNRDRPPDLRRLRRHACLGRPFERCGRVAGPPRSP